jgi:hypothetical protein
VDVSVLPEAWGSLLLDFCASVDMPAVRTEDGAGPPTMAELYQSVMITTRNGSRQLHSEP